MNNRAIILGLLCCACPLPSQATIYKCTNDGAIIYQDTPCKAGQSATAHVDAAPRLARANSLGESVLGEAAPPRSPFQFTEPVVGMTDTAVLNLRGWGRPSGITRSRTKGAWHEEWTYVSPADGQKQLQFTNGKLTAINRDAAALPADQRMAQITPQQR